MAHDDGDYGLVPRAGWRLSLFGWPSLRESRLRQRERGITIEAVTATLANSDACGHVTSRDQDAEWSVQVYGVSGTDAPQR